MSLHAVPRELYIYGAGGFGREVAWLASAVFGSEDQVEVCFVVDEPRYLTSPVNGIPVRLLSDVRASEGAGFVVAVGDAATRRSAAMKCQAAGLRPVSLVHPRTERSPYVDFGVGVVICAGVIITTNVTIGSYCHINLDCTVGHDAWLGDFVTVAPGVHISGNVHIEEMAYVGTGATIINGTPAEPLVIGAGAVVAAGACVTKSVEPGSMVAGVPAARKR
jgi:sugar O-acyltransferase (sialic acid O-acetyltransferase NeuD family)